MTVKEYTQKEILSQQVVNHFYESMGWVYDRSVACKDYDLTINGIYVEEKFRYKNYNDFLIEIMQDTISLNTGWYYKTKAKRVFYWVENKTLYSVLWDKFKEWFRHNWKDVDMGVIISKDGYGLTLNISIRWKNIPENCYKKFNI